MRRGGEGNCGASLRLPATPKTLVARPRLTDRLSDSQRVTTVVGPAGSGKSVLAEEWSATAHVRVRRFQSVALEAAHNDPMALWSSLLAAVRRLGAVLDAGSETVLRDELRQSRAEIPRTFLTSLLSALEDVPQRGILVLDDLHVIGTPAIREGLALFAARLPPTVHLVLMSRSAITDLSLHRLRLRDALDEITALELAFTAEESAEFLRTTTGLQLEPELADELTRRTEGWITGLKLAGDALRDAADPAEYVRQFAGRNRDIAEFLVGEVLDRQPVELRTFLLETSILTSLSADSCNAVTGREDSASQLRRLEAGGIFLTALDGNRDRFRYPTLFAEFLRAELGAIEPQRARALHRAACSWYERAGEHVTAVEHALHAGDHERAADVIIELVADHHRRGLDGTLQGWFRSLPEEVVAQRPELAVKRAWIHAYAGAPAETLRWCERADENGGDREDVTVESSCLRAHTYRVLGDLDATIEWGRRARDLLDRRDARSRHHDAYPRLAMTDAVAEAYGLLGDPASAIELLLDGLRRTMAGGNDLAEVSIPGQLAVLSSSMGELHDAQAYAERAAASAERLGLQGQPPTAELLVALGEVSWERNDLREAERRFMAAVDATRRSRRVWIRARALLGVARCRISQRSYDEAFAILETVDGLYEWGETPAFLAAQVARSQIRFRCAQGDPEAARDWQRRLERLVPGAGEDSGLEGRLLLVEGRGEEALRVLGASGAGEPRVKAGIERAMIVALASEQVGDRPGALGALATAVGLAEPQGFIRSIVAPATSLVAHALRPLGAGVGEHRPPGSEYLRELDRAVRAEQGRMAAGIGRVTHAPLREALSEAELAVIRFLPRDATYAEIAATRYVSVNTVKSQLRSIYRKLDVTSRVSAIERSRELGLLSG